MQYQTLLDNVYDWLILASSSLTDENIYQGDLAASPPVPENLPIYGFYRLISIGNKDLGGYQKKYNEDNDNFDTVSYNFKQAVIAIDLYSTGNGTADNAPTSSFDISDDIFSFVNTPASIEYMQEKNMGILRLSPILNQVQTISGQNVLRVQFNIDFSVLVERTGTIERIVSAPITHSIGLK